MPRIEIRIDPINYSPLQAHAWLCDSFCVPTILPRVQFQSTATRRNVCYSAGEIGRRNQKEVCRARIRTQIHAHARACSDICSVAKKVDLHSSNYFFSNSYVNIWDLNYKKENTKTFSKMEHLGSIRWHNESKITISVHSVGFQDSATSNGHDVLIAWL